MTKTLSNIAGKKCVIYADEQPQVLLIQPVGEHEDATLDAALEATRFDNCNPQFSDHVWGIFGEQDTLAHFEPLFLKYYSHSFHFPGGHTPTAQEVRTWYVPLAEKLLIQ